MSHDMLMMILRRLSKMCKIALDYAKEYDSIFNPLKCQFVKFSADNNVTFQLNGIDLEGS